MRRIIAHVDMDCFFCSCEIKRNPELKGKPVIVGGTGIRGVVSAANYEARTFGVFSATPISKAKELCPQGVYIAVDKKFYKRESEKIMKLFRDISDDMEQVSIDEAYLDFTSFSEKFNSLKEMGVEIQKKVFDATHLTCSIGISNSRRVSKIASDFKKPNGVTVINDAASFLAPLSIHKIPGIGKVARKKFEDNGVFTIGKLAEMNRYKVKELFGDSGLTFQDIALGKDHSGISHRIRRDSFSRETTFLTNVTSKDELIEEIRKLSQEVHKDLGNYMFKTVSIKLRYSDFKTITRDSSVLTSSCSVDDIERLATTLFLSAFIEGRQYRLIGVKVTNLSGGKDKQKVLRDYLQL
jgi:DNA polymerase IV (archaeal DinB-like DNA polymerase)